MYKNNSRRNMCPVHGIRLETTYYPELDLLISRCQEESCTDGHGMVENFKSKKERRKQSKKIKKAAQKTLDNMADDSTTDNTSNQELPEPQETSTRQ